MLLCGIRMIICGEHGLHLVPPPGKAGLTARLPLVIVGIGTLILMLIMPDDAPASFKRCLDNHYTATCLWQIPMKDLVLFYFR